MAIIYLTHPKHGAKIAMTPDEARSDMANGWKIFTLGAQQAPAPAPEVQDAPVVNALPSRRGRPRKSEPQGE